MTAEKKQNKEVANIFKKTHANPFNWVGSKHRYLKEFLEVLPNRDKCRVLDPFVGGGDLISKLPITWEITANDLMPEIYQLHKAIQEGTITTEYILQEYNKRGMSKTNKEAFLDLREEYNRTKDIRLLYLLMTNSFNNQLRFNKEGAFNMPFGANRSSFNPTMQLKLLNYAEAVRSRNISFCNKSCFDFDFSLYDLLIIDPPYAHTCATYNESTGWSEDDDKNLLDKIDASGSSFVYFNQTWSKGTPNKVLLEWLEGKDYVVLKNTSKGCNHQRKDGYTEEVMVYYIK